MTCSCSKPAFILFSLGFSRSWWFMCSQPGVKCWVKVFTVELSGSLIPGLLDILLGRFCDWIFLQRVWMTPTFPLVQLVQWYVQAIFTRLCHTPTVCSKSWWPLLSSDLMQKTLGTSCMNNCTKQRRRSEFFCMGLSLLLCQIQNANSNYFSLHIKC